MGRQKYMNDEHRANMARHEAQNPLSSRSVHHGQFSGRGRRIEGPAICGSFLVGAIFLGFVLSLRHAPPTILVPFAILIGAFIALALAVRHIVRNN